MQKRDQVKTNANTSQSKRHGVSWTANITTGKVSRQMGTVREIVRQETTTRKGNIHKMIV